MENPAFVKFIEKIGEERLASFTTHDFLVLNCLQHEKIPAPHLREWLPRLIELGVVESLGRGRGTRYILSRGLYAHLGQKGIYTRKKGLDRQTNKALLLRHLLDNAATGSALAELCQVLPSLSESAVQRLLGELKHENRIRLQGRRRWARWFPVNPKAQNV